MIPAQRFRTSALMLAFLASLAALIYLLLAPARDMHDWRSVEGRVEDSRAIPVTGDDDPDKLHWKTDIRYSYHVGGTFYRQDRIFAVDTPLPSDRSHAEELSRHYPSGKTVKVFYNPARPAEAVLVKGGDDNIRIARFMVLTLCGLFGWALYATARQRRM